MGVSEYVLEAAPYALRCFPADCFHVAGLPSFQVDNEAIDRGDTDVGGSVTQVTLKRHVAVRTCPRYQHWFDDRVVVYGFRLVGPEFNGLALVDGFELVKIRTRVPFG